MASRRRSRSTIVVLALASITLLTLDFQGVEVIDTARDGASSVFGPVESATDAAIEPLTDAWKGVVDYDELEAENEQLRQQLAESAANEIAAADAQAELKELMAEVGLDLPGDAETVIARVISSNSSNFDRTLEIDQGSDRGITVNMPVVNAKGLVGRVTNVRADRAVITLATETDFTVGVRLVTSRDVGLAHGTGDGRPLRIDAALEPSTEIELGESVVTSGLNSSNFPPGIPVGVVTEVDADGVQTPVVEVDLSADLGQLSFVGVVLWSPPS